MSKIAIIGDVHSCWTAFDTEYFNQSDYDYLLFTGDLPRLVGGITAAKKLAQLTKPAFLIPGNHDGTSPLQFIGELKNIPWLCHLASFGQEALVQRFDQALGAVTLTGYSLHSLSLLEKNVGLIGARPHSMGGNRLYFRPYLKRAFQVGSLEQSAQKLKQLIDQAPAELIFLGHNGPQGLGTAATDIWGCDFDPNFRDFGDADLRQAIDYAIQSGKRVWAVIGGHMHHRLKKSKLRRQWCVSHNGIAYINAAEVRRIYNRDGRLQHHHVSLTFGETAVRVAEIWVTPAGATHIYPVELSR